MIGTGSSLSINGIDTASYAINFVLSTGSSNFIYYLAKLVCDGLQNYRGFELIVLSINHGVKIILQV